MCAPMLRCTEAQRVHKNMPILYEAHSTPENRKKMSLITKNRNLYMMQQQRMKQMKIQLKITNHLY